MGTTTDLIVDRLSTKACLKQEIYKTTVEVFSELKNMAKTIANEVNSRLPENVNENVKMVLTEIGPFEFRLKFSGDTLAFQLHSNVITFPPDSPIMSSEYVNESYERGYFGSIRVYNFLSDSIKYNRLHDSGVMLARMFVNYEKKYYIDSGVEFQSLVQKMEKSVVNEKSLRFFVENSILTAIDIDLISPNYQDIQIISLQDHVQHIMGEAGSKLGFRMGHD